jgi:serine/threonine protein kinase/DNA-binding SARP family transcriptional activator/WD40 repeat protein
MTTLHVSLLGRFSTDLDGETIEIRSRISQSLFAYLVLHRETPLRRELLAGKFWPDSNETNARNNLRQALWQIRSALGQDVFTADKVTLSVDPDLEWIVDIDALSVDASASVDKILAAADVYHGDLLPGFYDDWVILEREHIRGTYTQLMERLLDKLIEAKRWPEVSEWAERWIALGHIPEPAFRGLLTAQAAKGDLTGVSTVYQRCVDMFQRELGMDPSQQTKKLFEQLMEGRLPVMPTPERYELREKIGSGGMGDVYRAVDTWLERDVAVKMLSSDVLGADASKRLLAEAQAAARLNHPNVVSVFDVGEMDGQQFIVMELVDGKMLHEHRPESQGEKLAIILEICEALEHAHAQGIVHRDIKPENVMIAADGMARLMDFGLASRKVDVPGASEGGTAGTLYYMAPELLRGETPSPQSDLYALGVLIYELLTGKLPFEGEDAITLIQQHLEKEPQPPSELNSEIRPALEILILRMMSKKLADRPLNAAAVAEVLEAVIPEDVQMGEPTPGEPPFKGLAYYDVDDAEIFFGREMIVEKIIEKLQDERFLAVIVGASGSGKSSIARAGIVPALREHSDSKWIFRLITPTEDPLGALAEALAPQKEGEAETGPTIDEMIKDPRSLHLAAEWLVETEGAERLLLVVDQLEEVFTLCDDEAQRAAFLDNLLTAADPGTAGPTTVVITLRADFYTHCAIYPELREALTRNQEYIGPMNTSELRRAIEEPALRGGWKFQSGLVDLMLRDVRGEPGALPLLSHALLETWKRRSRRTLTLKGYAEAGGVRRAIARTAELVYNQELNEGEKGIARNIFLRLTEFGEGTEDTRRRVAYSEFGVDKARNGKTELVLATLADARLITLTEDHVEVAHEALIREWPRLRGWLDEDREGMRIHRHLTEAAQAWEALDRDQGELYRGGRLAQAIEWNEEQEPELNPLEMEYLEASLELSKQREAEREARIKQLRRRAIYLGGALLAAVVLAFAAINFGRQADANLDIAQAANTEVVQESNSRATAQVEAENESEARAIAQKESEVQAQLARSRELAAAASNALDENPELSMLLFLQSIEESPQVHGVSASGVIALREAMYENKLIARIPIGSDSGWARITADGSIIYIWSPSEGKVSAIDVATETVLWQHQEETEVGTYGSFALSPDESLVAYALYADSVIGLDSEESDRPGRIVLLRTSDGSVEAVLPQICPFTQVLPNSFSPDGQWFMVYAGNENCWISGRPETDWIEFYNTSTWEVLYQLNSSEGWHEIPTFSSTMNKILISNHNGPSEIWSFPELELIHSFGNARHATLSPDGQRIVHSPSIDGPSPQDRVSVIDVNTGQHLFFLFISDMGFNEGDGVVYSPDGSKIIVLTQGKDFVFDAVDGKMLTTLGETGTTWSASFTADGNRLVTVTKGQVLLWDLSEEVGDTIELANAELAWFNPSPVLEGPNLAVRAFAIDDRSGWTTVVLILDEFGNVLHEFTGNGAQLDDGRFVMIMNTYDGFESHWGPLVVWDPESGEVTVLGHCSIPISVIGNREEPVECPGNEPLFGELVTQTPIVLISADGNSFAVDTYTWTNDVPRQIWIWDTETMEVRSILEVSYTEGLIALGTAWIATIEYWAESILIRDILSGEVIEELKPEPLSYSAFDLSADGTLLFTSDIEGGVWVFETMSWKLVAAWEAHNGMPRSLTTSKDGQLLVTTGNDDYINIWDISEILDRTDVFGPPQLIDKIPAPKPSGATWLSDDRLAAFLAFDAKWLEVPLALQGLVAEAVDQLTRSFTAEECETYKIDPCPTLDEIRER